MDVLGTLLDNTGASSRSMQHRLQKGEGCFWAHSQTYLGLGSFTAKLRSWTGGPATSAIYGACTWHVTQDLLLVIKRWEFGWLRKVLCRRRPDEGQFDFNSRTSKQIIKWCGMANCKFMHQRILGAIFKSAWRERGATFPGGTNHLRNARLCRSRLWWEFAKKSTSAQRGHFWAKHTKRGPLTEWEDVFVLVYGADWRSFRDSFETEHHWATQAPHFISSVCKAWSLPDLSPPSIVQELCSQPAPKRHRTRRSLDECPRLHGATGFNNAFGWESKFGRFCFITDCRPVQQVTCGHSALQEPLLTTSYHRLTHNIAALIGHGLFPPRRWDDPVLWRPREQNLIADYLANYTMDRGESWSEVFAWPFSPRGVRSCNLVVHSDGGSRKGTCSASAWIVEAGTFLEGQWHYQPIAMSGTYFPEALSSFYVETVALEECTLFLKRLVERCYDNSITAAS